MWQSFGRLSVFKKIRYIYLITQMLFLALYNPIVNKLGVLYGVLVMLSPTLIPVVVICVCSSILGLIAVGCGIFTNND